MSKEAVLNELNSQVGSLIHQSEWIDISPVSYTHLTLPTTEAV